MLPCWVNDLHWLATSPPLIRCQYSAMPCDEISSEQVEAINRLADDDVTRGRLLEARKHRLGHYFEALYETLMTQVMGWTLLARNIQIQHHGRTLGELDFLLRHPQTGQVEHHEIAVKFYLGWPSTGLWHGPNARDRLDLKWARLLNHQLPMSHRDHTQAQLNALELPLPERRRIVMPGALFYPGDESTSMAPPDDMLPTGPSLFWYRVSDISADWLSSAVILPPADWLGAYASISAPAALDSDELCDYVDVAGRARMLAHLAWQPAQQCWVETERCFVVPRHWPLLH